MNTKVKIHYDPITGKVKGNFPNSIDYNYPIPEPYIEIEESDQDKSGKQMVVIDGVYQEYVKPLAIQLQEAKISKLSQLLEARKAFQYKNIIIGGVEYIATQTACTNLDGAISVLTDNNLTECNWLDANGNASILTLALAKQLRTAMFLQQSNAYMQESALKVAIANCTTVEEVELLNITFS